MSEFKVGNEVEVTKKRMSYKIGDRYTIAEIFKTNHREFPNESCGLQPDAIKLVSKQSTQKEKVNMKKCISDVYEKTQDALLVEKWSNVVGIKEDNFITNNLIQDYKSDILKEAKRLEAESKKD